MAYAKATLFWSEIAWDWEKQTVYITKDLQTKMCTTFEVIVLMEVNRPCFKSFATSNMFSSRISLHLAALIFPF